MIPTRDLNTIDLKFGEMVKLPDLSMLDAMNALVILDPRMDTGCSSASSSSSSSQGTVDGGSRQGDVRDLELTPTVVVGMIDRLMQLEVSRGVSCGFKLDLKVAKGVLNDSLHQQMTYHTGATLVQTLFTSKHFLDLHALTLDLLNTESNPDSTSTSNSANIDPSQSSTLSRQLLHHLLIPYLHALRLCMYLVWTELTRGHVYDGEDFTSDTAGLWDRGKEWAVPRTRSGMGQDEEVDEDEDEGKGVLGYDECDFMLEDVLKRIEEGVDWSSRSECECQRV
jgi:hypothetical protein